MIEAVPVTLDRERTLLYNFEAFRAFQQRTGKSVLRHGFEFVWFEDVELFLATVWAGCLHEDPEVTVEEIAKAITFTDFSRVHAAVVEALGKAFGTATEDPQTAHTPSP